MKEDKIHVLSLFISSIVLFLITIIFHEIAIGLVIALICFPISNSIAKKGSVAKFSKKIYFSVKLRKKTEDRVMNHFKGKQFKKDVIIVAVGYYLRYNLSYREVQELLYDRGINVCHTTIYRWVQEYSKVLYDLWKKKNRQSFYSWKMDETYIKIKGRWHYLYRAIDADGLTLDIWLRKKRDTQAIVTDKAPSLGSAFRKLQSVGLYTKTEHRTVKYLNNLIEQDHRPIKRRNKFYQSLRTASSTIKGMETIRGIYKKNRRNGTLFGFSVSTEIKVNGNTSLRYLEFREGAFDFQTLQQNPSLYRQTL